MFIDLLLYGKLWEYSGEKAHGLQEFWNITIYFIVWEAGVWHLCSFSDPYFTQRLFQLSSKFPLEPEISFLQKQTYILFIGLLCLKSERHIYSIKGKK